MDNPWINVNERMPISSMSFVRVLRGSDGKQGVAHYNALDNKWLTAEQGISYKFVILNVTHWRAPTRKLWF